MEVTRNSKGPSRGSDDAIRAIGRAPPTLDDIETPAPGETRDHISRSYYIGVNGGHVPREGGLLDSGKCSDGAWHN